MRPSASPRRLAVAAALALLAACGEVGTGAPPPEGDDAEPPGSPPSIDGQTGWSEGDVVPDIDFDGIDADGAPERISLHDFAQPAVEAPRALVVLVSGGTWCGTCAELARHFDDAVPVAARGSVDRIDLILRDRDGARPDPLVDTAEWGRAVGGARRPIGIDPEFVTAGALGGERHPLPIVLVIDEATMKLETVLSSPSRRELARAIDASIGGDRETQAEPEDEPLVDGIFREDEWEMIRAMGEVPGAPPSDPTNAHADDPLAAALGRTLFFDAGLSRSGTVSCATCHDPARGLSDGRPVAVGEGVGRRRTPSIALAAHARAQDWDGRADTLWAQALGPLENPAEMGASRALVARRLLTTHRAQLEAAFPEVSLPSISRWTAEGRPGDLEFDDLSAADQKAITSVFVLAGKALEAYERTFRVRATRFDRYAAGDFAALDDIEKYGLQLFVRSGCTQCHHGPRLTDDAFHRTGAGVGGRGAPDLGRFNGLTQWAESEFRADGPHSDAPDLGRPSKRATRETIGQFKTPSLRGVADLDYFGHAGGAHDLARVTESYGHGTTAREPWVVPFGETVQWGLLPFLRVLEGDVEMP